MREKIKVSVIMPSLNVVKYIVEAIESVIHQDLKEIEIICVDAGSTDGTLEILQEYTQKDKRIKLILSDKKSYGYQMNLGIKAASGLYVGIVETDDFIPSNMYDELYSIADKNNLDLIKADFYRFTVENNLLRRVYNKLDPSEQFYGRIIKPANELGVFRMIMNTWSGVYKRDFLLKNNIFHNETPGASYQDNGFFFKTFCYAERAWFVNKPYYMNRRDRLESSVFNPNMGTKMIEEYKYIYEWLLQNHEMANTFKGMFAVKKYHNLFMAYNVLPEDKKPSFANVFAGEMKELIDTKFYYKESFLLSEWKRLEMLINNTDEFVRLQANYYKNQKDTIGKIFHKINIICSLIYRFYSWLCYESLTCAIKRVLWRKGTVDYVSKGEYKLS